MESAQTVKKSISKITSSSLERCVNNQSSGVPEQLSMSILLTFLKL